MIVKGFSESLNENVVVIELNSRLLNLGFCDEHDVGVTWWTLNAGAGYRFAGSRGSPWQRRKAYDWRKVMDFPNMNAKVLFIIAVTAFFGIFFSS